ncbi:multiple C2 and transmembrane domain-containing protein 1-like [Dermochelys coriacea]|uniref:multiple C2 and transmembrane domain-containing protein 1-like n=1 Tax=Dermochelys coriacea TaxID=27794 RepID=UPI0018E7CE6E|nr:multiple C2 and transmembrane domain-containing protein 1-like [Dermochelys coriacea]
MDDGESPPGAKGSTGAKRSEQELVRWGGEMEERCSSRAESCKRREPGGEPGATPHCGSRGRGEEELLLSPLTRGAAPPTVTRGGGRGRRVTFTREARSGLASRPGTGSPWPRSPPGAERGEGARGAGLTCGDKAAASPRAHACCGVRRAACGAGLRPRGGGSAVRVPGAGGSSSPPPPPRGAQFRAAMFSVGLAQTVSRIWAVPGHLCAYSLLLPPPPWIGMKGAVSGWLMPEDPDRLPAAPTSECRVMWCMQNNLM